MLKGNEIRQLYLDFFKDKHQHTVVESSSLVPDNPTVLLTTAGMLQFLPIFLGIVKSPYDPARATSCQKCARAGGKDSDNRGYRALRALERTGIHDHFQRCLRF